MKPIFSGDVVIKASSRLITFASNTHFGVASHLPKTMLLLITLVITRSLREFPVTDVPPPPPADTHPGLISWSDPRVPPPPGKGRLLPLVTAASAVLIAGVPVYRRAVSIRVQQLMNRLRATGLPARGSTHGTASKLPPAPRQSALPPPPPPPPLPPPPAAPAPVQAAPRAAQKNDALDDEAEKDEEQTRLEADAAAALAFTAEPPPPPQPQQSPSPSPSPAPPATAAPSKAASELAPAERPPAANEPTPPPPPHTPHTPVEAAAPPPAPLEVPPLRAFCSGLSALQRAMGPDGFPSAAKLLLRYCDNAGAEPFEPKFRRIKVSNAVYQKHLVGQPAAAACLAAVGFVEGRDAESDEPILIMGTADAELLLACAFAARRRLQMLSKWPAALHECLPAACEAFEHSAEGAKLLDALTEELAQPHVPQLLAHADNRERVMQQLTSGGAKATARLVKNLAELRQNLTATQAKQQQAGGGAAGGTGAAPSRVKRIRNNEQWYDTLMGTKGLVVVDFGATWCKACQQVKPQFEALSSAAAYKEVTFVSVDADECPVLVGDNRVDAFPTFKFFRNSAEEDLPVVGADIEEVRERLDELLAGAA